MPIALLVPHWLAPPYGSPAYNIRSMLQPEYLPIVMLYTVQYILGLIAELSLAMFMAKAFVEELKFPFVDVDIAMVTFVSEKPARVVKFFLLFMLIGVAWGVFAYAPTLLFNYQAIPIPFFDLTRYLEDFIPGGALGIGTILATYFSGFILPFNSAAFMIVASLMIWVVFNSLFAVTFPNIFPEWSKE